ncbi:MAG: glycoside hydrolase family 65 protein, partial [Chloroflexota bacterium]|nr:glycoside hydrolase family 65 protein [Chloroflexota bacterium]
ITIATAMRLVPGSGDCVRSELWDVMDRPTRTVLMKASPGSEIVVEKHVAIATSRDAQPGRLASLTRASIGRVRSWTEALGASTSAWAREWARCDVTIEGDDRAQLAIRHCIYQLLIAGPRADDSVNIGAKTLSGFGYRGHAFWDTESFMLPFFTFTSPRIARNLLTSRSRQLPAAQANARQAGYRGAQFPWESADTGEEVTPSWLPDPSDPTRLQRIWTGDLEIHISADVAIAAYRYWQVTADDAWFAERGAEIVLGTAAFWASRAEWSADRSACGYRRVIGPDEYHEHVDNNHFTNALARWNLRAGSEVWDWLGSYDADRHRTVSASLGITRHDVDRWRTIIDAIHLPVGGDGLIEQFDGYFQRRDLDLAEFETQTRSMQAILGVEGVQETQIIKQPDVLAAMHLLPEAYDDRQIVANYRYYAARTDGHGSSLGPATMAIVASRAGLAQEAYEHFMQAALVDLEDIRGNTAYGIHGAAAGGAWQAIAFGFAGLRLTREGYSTESRLPPHWARLQIRFTHRGVPQLIDMKGGPEIADRR